MSQKLQIVAKQARELSEKATMLSDKLQGVASLMPQQSADGIDPFIFAITIFTLACFIGYYVVWRVTPALHTPLISITNAISGIIIIGAIIASGSEIFDASTLLGFIAVFFASINIFGGFVITQRMVQMFKNKK